MTAITGHREDGSAVALGASALVVAAVLTVLGVDLGAYLLAATRAQNAADAGALAAAAVADPRGHAAGDPTAAARAIVTANSARLLACDCKSGRRTVRVTVDVEVRALVITRFAGRRVTATADARLVPP